ncbi:efflux transporter outer membrane subunit [Novosphingobium umbonatum]|uniref:Efflux transporter outer membrane subunit n=1 Tax=Novosphingobium umbonatum TaxID=1908524 RepID=A0A3S3TKV9_9SPHN|nr:efflux transporter outer membrane subunit [Novosphingobium umbonatum]RVU03383.1 efflux transporter outer membrane subunit [Novosphingobium umbonatum]
MRKAMILALLPLSAQAVAAPAPLPVAPIPAAYAVTEPLAPLAWRDFFGDARLQRLIALALNENRDLRIALLNAQAARAALSIARGAQLPTVEAQGNFTSAQTAGGGFGGFRYDQFTGQVSLTSFELDLFGRLRAQTRAAFDRYLASEAGRRASELTVIGAVAEAYVAQRLAQEQRQLTASTLADWRVSLDLTRRLHDAGQSSGRDLAQAEGLVRQAEADLAQRQREEEQATHALSLAIGAPLPADLPEAVGLMASSLPDHLAAGLPSELLTNRPDIVQAEYNLRAAQADVSAARAAFFPRLSLTGALGVVSPALSNLFSGGNKAWNYVPAVALPLFPATNLKGNLRQAKAQQDIAVATYEKAIQTAFAEVADGISAQQTYGPQLAAQAAAAEVADRRVGLSKLRYQAGVDSRLELLDAQRSAYSARQSLLSARAAALLGMIRLYRALGHN